ncbi:[protein-PII] uridylyltransferase [uncultured Brevundimonas sp.]|uniref:[protein-PII] uridylyltransferase n=1 Tax=uncultured Brevundimonas sp. TaxID=213418 RepID=UPI0026364D17|nr:[protein-PII] uridylyltransferase [uncultured Brevundimonas sp.]
MTLDPRLLEAASGADVRAGVTAVLREGFDAGRDRARRRLEGGGDGAEVARLYAEAADRLLTDLWAVATEVLYPAKDDRLSLIAVGGYGRGVLAPYSDLDFLILRRSREPSDRAVQVSEFVHYVLWDLGLKVGSSFRSLHECLDLAGRDMTVRTTLLEARPIAGDRALGETLLRIFRRIVREADPKPFIAAKMAERDVRIQKAGGVRNRVEPNVKDGKGGLRDLNTLFWIALSVDPDGARGKAALQGLLRPGEMRSFREAIGFLWKVRIHLHLVAGRAEEKLTFDFQPEIARRMGWRGRGDELAVERFMRRYFLVSRQVGALTRAVSAQLEARQQKKAEGLSRGLSRLLRRGRGELAFDGLIIEQGRLSVTHANVFARDPVRLLTLFVEADRLDIDLHPDAITAVIRSLSLVTPATRRDPRASEAILHLLAGSRRPYRVLSLVNETGLLGRFLPEWSRIVGQTQFNMYHAYTVDEHTLQAIGIIDDIKKGKLEEDHPAASRIIHRIVDHEALMLAMLLHDVGKGGDRGQLEDGAIAARRACERLRIDPRRIEQVVWLVRNHLLMSDYAQKRDVSDPATVRAFAEAVSDLERLRMLMVLTVADIRAVGPGVWNGWKGQLMRTLFDRTEALFRGDTVEGEPTVEEYQDLIERARFGGVAVETALPQAALESTSRIAVATADRSGLFADLTATLALAGADVVGARLTTLSDGTALEIFEIQDGVGEPYGQREPRRLSLLARAMERAALKGARTSAIGHHRVSARRAIFDVRPVVRMDREFVPHAVVVEVSGADRPGLLSDLARIISDRGFSVQSAHVACFGERAVDAFYVTGHDGQKPTDTAQLDLLQAALLEALDMRLEGPEGRRITPVRASTRDVSVIGTDPVSKTPVSR